MKIKTLIMSGLMVWLGSSCQTDSGQSQQAINTTKANPNEEYVMVTPMTILPMYVNHDINTFKRWGESMGVKTNVVGPTEWDMTELVNTFEQVVASKPTGILLNGADPGLVTTIGKAIEAGIPVVLYDIDLPQSKRLSFVGTDWYQIGQLQGRKMVEMIGGKGKVAYLGIVGVTQMELAFKGFLDVLKGHPQIEIVGRYDDKSNLEEAARLTSDLLRAHPDLAGIAGFDSQSGPGIGLAIKEAGKKGTVKVTAVDAEPEHLRLVKDGVIQYLVGQKRELFTWYGAQLLFDHVHQANKISKNDKKAGIHALPTYVNTGLYEVTSTNVNEF